MTALSMTPALNPSEMLEFADRAAADAALVASLPRHPRERTWMRLAGPGGAEAWLIGWPPGTGTGWHDHGGVLGAFLVARGTLHEYTPPTPPVPPARDRFDGGLGDGTDDGTDDASLTFAFAPGTETQVRLPRGSGRSFPYDHIHDVRNISASEHAVSVHVYAPRLRVMRLYDQTPDRLVFREKQYSDEW